MIKNKQILLIDSHFIGYQAKLSHADLSFEEFETGVMFGFLSRILSLCKFFQTNDVVFCFDSKHSKRKSIYPKYKSGRHKDYTSEELKQQISALEQFNTLRSEILSAIGFKNIFQQAGYEADDLIAKITHEGMDDYIIISSDQDLYQLLASNVRMFNPSSKKMVTRKSFTMEYNISPQQWVIVKQMAGCTSDTVQGIKGVGAKSVIKYLNKELKTTSAIYNKIVDANPEELALYHKLVNLPFPKTRDCALVKNEFNIEGFTKMCGKCGFESFLVKAWDDWIELFKGEYKHIQRKVKTKRKRMLL